MFTSGLTPKITQLLGLNSGGNSIVISYFGPMSFLDDQKSLASVFGNRPQFLGSDPSRLDTRDIGDKLRLYADKCMFDVFLNIYRVDYVGTDVGTSDSKMLYEICKKLAKLRMEWRTTPGNKIVADTYDDLYAMYISIVASLPDDATVWPLLLCNTYSPPKSGLYKIRWFMIISACLSSMV